MSEENKPYPSRLNKRNRSNSILNMMIGLVFTLILIVGAFIFMGQNDSKDNAQEPESVQIASDTEEQTDDEDDTNSEKAENTAGERNSDAGRVEGQEESENNDESDEKSSEGTVTVGGTITREDSNDPIVDETIINTSWEPVGTEQSGKHVSVYQKGHIDWEEKIDAISYATGLDPENMYIMRVENGGGPQNSVGVVQSKDKSEKYRVHMTWVDGKGWKPVKMDVLKTLEGAY